MRPGGRCGTTNPRRLSYPSREGTKSGGYFLDFLRIWAIVGVKPIPSWNSSRLLIAYAAFFFNVVVSIFSCRFNASRSLGRCR